MDISELGRAIDSSISEGRLPEIEGLKDFMQRRELFARRLNWLGYPCSVDSEQFASAISKFQEDCGLKVSGLIDSTTFNVLDRLVAFESEEKNNVQLDDFALSNLGFRKAVKLRLSLFGLNQSNVTEEETIKNLSKFKRLLIGLGVAEISNDSRIDDLLGAVFDIDKITKGVKGDTRNIHFRYPLEIKTRNQKEKYRNSIYTLVKNLAAIELWLYGYPIKLDRLSTNNINLDKSMKQFWKDTPQGKRPPLRLQTIVTVNFFNRINELQDKEPSDSEVSGEVFTLLSDESFRENVQKQSDSLLSRFWDGFKKVKRLIFAFSKRVVRAGLTLIKNVARWLVSGARDAFTGIATLFKASVIGFKHLFQKRLLDNQEFSFAAIQFTDFDQSFSFNNGSDLSKAKIALGKRTLAAQLFEVGIIGVVSLWRVFKFILRTYTGAGWLLLFWSMVRFQKDFDQIMKVSCKAKVLLRQWDGEVYFES